MMRSRLPARSDRPAISKLDVRFRAAARFELVVWALLVAALVFASSTQFTIEYTLPKLLALYATTPLLLLLWTRRHVRGTTILVPPGGVAAFAIALVAWWAVSTAAAVHPPTALEGAHGRFNGLWTHLFYLTLFGLCAATALTRSQVDARLRVFVVCLVGAAVLAAAQAATPDLFPSGRAIATIGNAVVLGACLSLGVPIATAFAIRSTRIGRVAWTAAALTLAAGVMATGSRGPVAGLIASMILMALIVADDLRIRRSWLAAACAMAALLAIAGASRVRSGMFVPSLHGLATAQSSQDRLNTLRAAVRITRDHPWLGVGFENFSIVYPRYRVAEADRMFPDELPTMVHSGYLQTAATNGLPGLALYLALVVSVLVVVVRALRRTVDRDWRVMLAGLLASITGYLIADITGWEEVSLTALFWMLLGLTTAVACAAGDLRRASQLPVRGLTVAAASVWAALALALAFRLVQMATADWHLRQAAEWSRSGVWALERLSADQALAWAGDKPAYVDAVGVHYGVRFGATGEPSFYTRAAELFETAHRLNPFNEYVLIHRVDLETAALQKHPGSARAGAIGAAEEVTAQDWHNATSDVALARFELARGSLPAALAAVTRARVLRPDSVAALMVEGDVLHAMRLPARAASAYRSVLSSPGAAANMKVDAERRLTVCLLEDGAAGEALVHARALVALSPADSIAQQLLSIATASAHAGSPAR